MSLVAQQVLVRDAVPTAPGRLPLLGHAVQLATGRLRFLQSLRDHGDLVRIYLGTRPAYVVNSPELLRGVLLTDAAKFDKGRFFEKMRPVLGTGILTCDTDVHRRQRSLVQPAFHHERIRRYVDIMSRLAGQAVGSWRQDQVVEFDKEMHAVALDIVATSLFSSKIGEEAVRETQRLFPYISHSVARRTLSPFPWLERLPTADNRRYAAAVQRLWQVIDEVIAAYRAQGVDHGDLLSMLLASQDSETGDGLTDREVRDESVTLMGAGTETSSNSLCWLFHEFDRNPDVQDRVRDEIERVIGDRPVRYDDVKALTYTQNVISETLRLHSPIWFLMRRVIGEIELGGVRMEPGTQLLFSPTALHRDPEVYTDPLRFDPDRWESEQPKLAFLPFGMGPRKCIGDIFARTEMAVITATILRRWRLEAVGPMREVCSGSLHPAELPMRVRSL
jgi:cytochrome P450